MTRYRADPRFGEVFMLRYYVFGLGLLLLGGLFSCDCSGRVITAQVQLKFRAPTNGTVLTAQDDVLPGTSGIQVDVVADVIGLGDGAEILLTNSVDRDGSGLLVATRAVVANKRVTFPAYTLPLGQAVTLRVALAGVRETDVCDGARCDEATVTVVQSICYFSAPSDGDVITTDAYPEPLNIFDPVEIDVALQCYGVNTSEFVAVQVNGGRLLIAQPDTNGVVTLPRVALSEGANALQSISQTDANGRNPGGATELINVTVNTGRCITNLDPPDGSTILATDDIDLDPTNGLQVNLDIVTDCADTASVSLYLKGPNATDFSPVTLGQVDILTDPVGSRFRLRNISLPESVDPFDVEMLGVVEEVAPGRTGASVPSGYWVDSTAPILLSWAPADGACIGTAQDTDLVTPGLQISTFGNVFGAPDASEVWARVDGATPATVCTDDSQCTGGQVCRAGFCRYVGSITAGNFVINNMTLPAGTVTVTYTALDLAGNTSASETAQLDVFDTVPSVVVTDPTENQNLGLADDSDSVLGGFQYDVHVAVNNLPAGSSGTLVISGQAPVDFVPASGSGESVQTVSLVEGSRTILARVQDACGGLVESAPVGFSVSLTAPEIGIVATASNNTTCALHSDSVACQADANCMWNATVAVASCVEGLTQRIPLADGSTTRSPSIDLDLTLGTANAARNVTISRFDTVTFSGPTRSCSGAGGPLQSLNVAANQEGALLTNLFLNTGNSVSCFVVDVTSGANSASASFLVNRRVSVPNISITDPSAGVLSPDSNGSVVGFNYSVVLGLSGGPNGNGSNDIAGTARLLLGPVGSPYATLQQDVAAGAATVTFTDASLPSGTYSLLAEYEDTFGNVSQSASVVVTVDSDGANDQPQLVIVAPADAAVLRNADLAVTVQLVGGTTPDGSCDLYAAAAADQAGSSVGTMAWAGSSITFAPPGGLSETAHFLRVECPTTADGTGISQIVQINIDDTAPAIPDFQNEPPSLAGALDFDVPGAFVNTFVSDTSALPGLQHGVAVVVATGGLPAVGFRVELTVTPPGGSPTLYQRTLTSGGDPVLVTFAGVDFGSALNGTIDFSARVFDRAGNVSSDATASFVIDREPPIITQVSPNAVVSTLFRADDILPATPQVDVDFVFSVTGASAGADCLTTPEQCLALTILPFTHNHPAGDFPLYSSVGGGDTSFGTQSFDDGSYFADLQIFDAAGNPAVLSFNFDVQGLAPELQLDTPSGVLYLNKSFDGGVAAGLQTTFTFVGAGFAPGTPIVLCSSLPPPGGGAGACRYGRSGADPVLGGANIGTVVGTSVIGGSVAINYALFSNVTLAEGDQWINAEAIEGDGQPDVSSSFTNFVVDSNIPVVNSLAFNANSTGNDAPPTLRLNATEGTVNGSQLTTPVTSVVTGVEAGRVIQVLSDLPANNTIVGGTLAGGSGTDNFSLALVEGSQTIRVRVSDLAGNFNNTASDVQGPQTVVVDITPPQVSVAAPTFDPYTSLHGSVVGSNLIMNVDVSVSDNQALAGAQVKLARYTQLVGGTEVGGSAMNQSLSNGQTTASFVGVSLVQGLNYLGAQLTDAAGNVTNSLRVTYRADFLGPTLALDVRTGGGSPVSVGPCDTEPAACVADVLPPSNSRSMLDTNDSNNYCPPLSTVATCDPSGSNQTGTTLFYSLVGCANSDPALENCATNPITIRLESRVTSTASFSPVFASTGIANADVASFTSYSTVAAAFAFDPGRIREVRLVAVDHNGNVSVSPSKFLRLDMNGVLIEVERLVAATPTGDFLADDRYFGQPVNAVAPPNFAFDLRVSVMPVDVEVPVQISLSVTNGLGTQNYGPVPVVGSVADFSGANQVLLQTSPNPSSLQYNLLVATVDCAAPACGERDYQNLIADVVAPTYQFDRCSLCSLGVPLSGYNCGSPACTAVDGDASANIADPAGATAAWNAAGDHDATPSNGFTINGVPPTTQRLRVRLHGMENGQTVTLVSDQPSGLSGNAAVSSSCPSDATCVADFSSLHVSSLTGSSIHKISVQFTDRAGNAATPDVIRGDSNSESIYARVDVRAPGGVAPVVCIGESTTPVGLTPANDLETFENPSCAASCLTTSNCDRRSGLATLRIIAPDEDGASAGQVANYHVSYASLGVQYGAHPILTSCDTFDPDSFNEGIFSQASTVAPGGVENFEVSGLLPHRAYCFSVRGEDELGNLGAIGTFVVRRDVPLINHPSNKVVNFSPEVVDWRDDAQSAAYYVDPNAGASTFSQFGHKMANVGDLDGDGRSDFVVMRRNPASSGAPPSRVFVFLSSSAGTQPAVPDVVIDEPAIDGPGASLFAFSVAGGDYDGDGRADLAICAPFASSTGFAGSGAFAGALYLYYGVSGLGISRTANSGNPYLPSIVPDVVLQAPAVSAFCLQAAIGDVDPNTGNDLVVTTLSQVISVKPRVYGFSGGNRNHFPGTAPVIINLDLVSAAGPGASNRPDFAISPEVTTNQNYPHFLALANLNGDVAGKMEIAVSDNVASHGSGRAASSGLVFVYRGGTGMTGEIATPSAPGGQLLHLLRHFESPENEFFGNSMSKVTRPRAGDNGDWLLVQSGQNANRGRQVVVFKGTSLGGSPGIVPANYPMGGAASYFELERSDWRGRNLVYFGDSLDEIGSLDGDGGVDVCVAPGAQGDTDPFNPPDTRATVIYSYDAGTDMLEKHAVLYGKGGSCIGIGNYLGLSSGNSPQFILGSETTGSIFLFR